MKTAVKKKAPACPRPLALKLKRLRLKDGDVLVLRVDPRGKSVPAIIDSLRVWLSRNGLKNTGILILSPEETVESLSEQRLREMGWIRPYEVIR